METLLPTHDRETTGGKVLNIFLEAPKCNKMVSKIWEKKEIWKGKPALRASLPPKASVVWKKTARDPAARSASQGWENKNRGLGSWLRLGVLTNVPHPAFGVGVCLGIKSKFTMPYNFLHGVKNLNIWNWSKVNLECWCPQAPTEVKEILSGGR